MNEGDEAMPIRSLKAFVAVVSAILTLAGQALAGDVGFAIAKVPDPPGPTLEVGIWYPTHGAPSPQALGLLTQTVAPDAAVDGQAHPLVIISHGTGGYFASHYDTALALAHGGYIVAAPTHTGDNYRDQSQATQLPERPRAVRSVIDYMLTAWPDHGRIDPARIGIFGFSSGGFTALVSIGGIPDLSRIAPYCASHADTFVCQVTRAHGMSDAPPVPTDSWIFDRRIKAAVVAAPALGFAFTREGLKSVSVPVQLWRAEDDHILPAPDYAEAVRDALPSPPDYHVVAGADHFDFLSPCSPAMAAAVPTICEERGGFDRAAFHARLNQDIVRFFDRTLR
jgi:predicted dienelactone hydrolase